MGAKVEGLDARWWRAPDYTISPADMIIYLTQWCSGCRGEEEEAGERAAGAAGREGEEGGAGESQERDSGEASQWRQWGEERGRVTCSQLIRYDLNYYHSLPVIINIWTIWSIFTLFTTKIVGVSVVNKDWRYQLVRSG